MKQFSKRKLILCTIGVIGVFILTGCELNLFSSFYKVDKLDPGLLAKKLKEFKMLENKSFPDTSLVYELLNKRDLQYELYNKTRSVEDSIKLLTISQRFDSIFINFAFEKFFEKEGLVTDAKTASKIAYIYLSKIYGKSMIRSELPLIVYSFDDYWYITGTFRGFLFIPPGYGGVAEIGIKKSNGQVVEIAHGK